MRLESLLERGDIPFEAKEAIKKELSEFEQVLQAKKEFQKQRDFFLTVLNALNMPFYVIDIENYTVKLANVAATDGRSKILQTCYHLTHGRQKPCTGEKHICPLNEVKNTKKPIILEHTHYDKTGNPEIIEIHAHPVFDTKGTLIEMIEFCFNITDRKRLEEEILQLKEELSLKNQISNIFLRIPDDNIYAEVLQVILDVLESKYGVFGYINEEGSLVCPSMTKDIWDRCQIPDKNIIFPQESWGGIWGRALTEKKPFYSNGPFNVPEGHIPITRALTVPIIYHGEVIGYILVANRITDYDENDQQLLETIANYIAPILHTRLQRDLEIQQRKQAQNDLIKTKARLEYLLKSGPAIIYACEPWGDCQTVFMSENVKEILGYHPRQFQHNHPFWVDGIHPEDRQRVTNSFSKVFDTKFFSDVYRFQHKDGTYRWMLEEANLIRDEQGNPLEIVGYWTDISERKRVEEKLQESEEQYRTLFENIPIGLYRSTPEHKFLAANSTFIKQVGLSSFEELCKLNPDGLANKRNYPRDRFLKEIDEKGEVRGLEFRLKKPDGTIAYIRENARAIKDSDGSILHYEGSVEDITDRILAEEQLRNERENLYNILNSTDDGMYIINSQHKIEFINAALEKEFGPVEEKKCYEYFNDFNESCPWCTMEKVLNGETIRREKTLPRNQKTYDMIDTPFRNLDGSISSLAILRDITERKKTEQALREGEEKYRSFVENFQGIAFRGYEDFSTDLFSGKIEEITGYTEADFLSGKINYIQLIHPEDVPQVNADVKEFMPSSRKTTQREYQIIDKSGNLHWIQEFSQKFYDETIGMGGVYGTLQDITKRKLAEEALKESEEKFRSMAERTSDWIWEVDTNGIYTYASPKVKDILGYEPEKVIGKTPFDLMPTEEAKRVEILFRNITKSQEPFERLENINLHKNGRHVVLETSGVPIFGADGKLIGYRGIDRDITDRKQAEEEIKKFKTIANNAGYGVEISDIHGNLIYVNDSFAKMHDYTADEIIGKNFSIFHTKEQMKNVNRLADQLRQKGSYIAEEVWHKRKDNENFPTLMNSTLIIDEKGKPQFMAATAIDITKRKQTEEALRESEELFAQFMDHLPAAAFIKDKDSVTLFANKYLKDVFGGGNWIGKTALELFPEEVARKMIADDQKALTEGLQIITEELKDINNIINTYQTYKFPIKRKNKTSLLGGIAFNITEQKQAEEALRESEAKYRNLVERANDGIAIIQDRKLKFLNRQVAEILGYTVEEMLNTPFINYVHPDQLSRALKRYQARMAGQEVPSRYEMKLIRKDGQTLEVEINAGVINYQNSLADFAIVRDFTERKRAEEQLQYQANLLKNVSDAVISSDLDFKITSWNKAAETIYGWQEEEVLGKEVGQLLGQEYPNDRREDVINQFMSEGVWRGEVIQRRKDGTAINILTSVALVKDSTGRPIAALAVNHDITKRKQVEEALKRSEEKYRLLFESVPIGIGIADLEGHVFEGNQTILETTGYTLDEIKTISLVDSYVNPEDRKKLLKELHEFGYVRDFEVQLKRKDGTPYYSLLNITLMELGEQKVLLTTQRDLTEWMEMDRAKRESEERLRMFMESATDGFTLLDLNLNFTDLNKAGLEALGLSKEEIVGKNFLDIFPKLQKTGDYNKYQEVLKTGEPYYIDDIMSAPKIGQKYYSLRVFKVGEGLGIISTDITDRAKAEKARKELEQKRDSFVWMTSHELRTPLTVLTGYCDFLIDHMNDLTQKRITNILSVMKNNLDRLERLTNKVSTIGQIERGIFDIEKSSMNLCEFLQNTLEPYQHLLGDQFEFQGCPEDSPIIIDGDPNRLQQVLDNIIGNAIKQTDKNHRKIMVRSKIYPTDIKIEISDNGAGIAPNDLEIIFDQFVSIPTEYSATGTGIGLYLCRKTLEAHGGIITAQSKSPGHGATFTIELPRKNAMDSRDV